MDALNRFPLEAGPSTRVPRTARELIEALSYQPPGKPAMFHCMQGQPRAYMEIKSDDARLPCLRGVYSTLRYVAPGRKEDAESILVSTMFDVFVRARAMWVQNHGEDTPLLFWRAMPHVEEDHSQLWDQYFTHLRCRVWIPGVDMRGWASPDNDGDRRYV